MNEETHQKLMTIKRSFRLLMNGPGSQSMRDKGLGYKLNWGVPFYELKKMAQEYGKDYDLAIRQDACRDHGYLDGTGTEPGDG